jgi:hypothetical protein
MAKKTLQSQGVPVPDRLRGPGVPASQGRTVQPRNSYAAPSRNAAQNSRSSRGTRSYNPATIGADATGSLSSSGGSVGTLEAEFLIGLALLILLMFSSQASYSDKIMSVMKRGALMCVLFFILAMVSSAGPNAAKISKAMGALVIVALLVTSPVNTVVTDLDNLIKNDWVGTTETGGTGSGNTGSASAANGTQQSTNNLGQDFINAIEQQLALQGQKVPANPVSKAGITQDIKNALNGTLNGIIPGSGSILNKLGL